MIFKKKVEKDDREIWETINIDDENFDSPHYIPRNYLLFSVLADVRNGTGFAGVITYKPVVPISEPRGLPDDLPRDEDGKDTSREGWCFNEDEEDWRYGDEFTALTEALTMLYKVDYQKRVEEMSNVQ